MVNHLPALTVAGPSAEKLRDQEQRYSVDWWAKRIEVRSALSAEEKNQLRSRDDGLAQKDPQQKQKDHALKIVKIIAKLVEKNIDPKHFASFIENISDAGMLDPVAQIFALAANNIPSSVADAIGTAASSVGDAASTVANIASVNASDFLSGISDSAELLSAFSDPTGISAAVSIVGIAAKASVFLLRAVESNVENPTLKQFVGALADAGALVSTVTDIAKNFTVPGIFFAIAGQIGDGVSQIGEAGSVGKSGAGERSVGESVGEKFANALQEFFTKSPETRARCEIPPEKDDFVAAIEKALKHAAEKFQNESEKRKGGHERRAVASYSR